MATSATYQIALSELFIYYQKSGHNNQYNNLRSYEIQSSYKVRERLSNPICTKAEGN